MEQRTLAEVVKAFTQFRIKELNLDSSVFKKRWEYFPGLHSFLQWQESYMYSDQMINNFLKYQESKRKDKKALRMLNKHCRYLVDFANGKEVVLKKLSKYPLKLKESEEIFSEIVDSQLPQKLQQTKEILIRHFLFLLEKSNTPLQNISNQAFQDFTKEIAVTDKKSQQYVVRVLKILGKYAEEKYGCNFTIDFAKEKQPASNRREKYPLKLQESVRIFSEIVESQLPQKLQQTKITLIRHFLYFLEKSNTSFQNISNQTFLDFIKETAVTNKGSQNYVVLTLRLLSKFAKEKYNCSFTIDFSYWKIKRTRRKVIEPFTNEEIKLIYQEMIKNPVNGARDSAIVILAATTGLRYCDVSSLKLSDINWEKKKLYILQNKTKVPVEIPLINKVLNVLADYILNHRPETDNPFLFLTDKEPYIQLKRNNFYSLLNDYCKKAGVVKKEGRAFHSLRRSFATELSIEDVPLTTISQLLGHTNIISDKVYLTYNVSKTLECSFDFSEIPLKSPVYMEMPL